MSNYAIAFITVLGSLCHQAMAATLTGSVVDELGEPIASATVDISTAAPLGGRGIFCPSCYLDCQKRTKTDVKGHFEITGLDGALRFRVLFAAEGKATHITKLFEPQSGPLDIQLSTAPKKLNGKMVKGIVVDATGRPINGALLTVSGAESGNRRRVGRVGILPVVSDRKGRFELVLPKDYLGVNITARADGYAGTRTNLIQAGKTDARIEIPLGATVHGQLIMAGQSVSGELVAVAQTDQNSESFNIKAVARTTDAKGQFTISNLPANQIYVVFSPIGEGDSLTGKIIKTKKFWAPKDGQEHDLGKLKLRDGLSLAGRVVSSSGKTLPSQMILSLRRTYAWDLIKVIPNPDGNFEIDGLPPENYEIRLALKNYEIDESQLRIQRLDKKSCGFHLTESNKELTIPICHASPPVPRPEELGIDLNRGNQTLSGIVVDPSGNPISGISVAASLVNSYHHLSASSRKGRRWKETDRSGRFEIVDLPDVPIRLRAYERGSSQYPAQTWPSMNSRGIRIIYDPGLLR